MTIVGIGCDLLSLTRLRGVILRRGADRLAARILSKTEAHEYAASKVASPLWSPDRVERFLGTR
jgi:phosphopantetheinyl transferase (holo-ACP synthase)